MEPMEIGKKEAEKQLAEEKTVESLKIKASTKERLLKLGRMKDSFDDVINRKLDELEACKLGPKPIEEKEVASEETTETPAPEEEPEDTDAKEEPPE